MDRGTPRERLDKSLRVGNGVHRAVGTDGVVQVDRANDSTKFLSFAKLTEQYYELMKHEATILPAR